jgi:hypothetical protein
MNTVEQVAFGGWTQNAWLSNGTIELVITGDVGPRIIRCGFVGKQNLFAEYKDQFGKTGGTEWNIFGGHRLWHAPEHPVRTYYPDNMPVKLEYLESAVHVTQAVEPTTGIQKSMELTLTGDTSVRVVHRLHNMGAWPVELAPWALSVMAPGGTVVIPLPPRGSHPKDLLPANSIVLWPYMDMSDSRWTWGQKYILLRQNANGSPQKIGLSLPDGWAAYILNGQAFVKQYQHIAGATYPDLGSSFETFTNQDMLEVETLGPLQVIQPGASVEHIEYWHLIDGIQTPKNDADVEAIVLPSVRSKLT